MSAKIKIRIFDAFFRGKDPCLASQSFDPNPPLEKCIISGRRRRLCKFPRSRSRPPHCAAHLRLPRASPSVLFRGKLGGGATDLSGKNCCGALEFGKRRSSFACPAAAQSSKFKAQFPHHTIRTCSFLPLLMRVHLLVAKRRPHLRFGPCLKRCTTSEVCVGNL